jgi:protocatechuate 3,4-dioxygenase, alpha subunit
VSAESLVATPGQTIGPFFGFALPYEGGEQLVPRGHPDAVRLTGLVLDGHAHPVPDAMIEIWQADVDGRIEPRPGSLRRDGYTFTGWGRAVTDNTGRYSFTTVRPGPTSDGKLPFFAMAVFARGLTNRLFTRAYLPTSPDAIAADRLLGSVPEDRRRTLIAAEDCNELRFDVRLQGEEETVFLTFPGDAP